MKGEKSLNGQEAERQVYLFLKRNIENTTIKKHLFCKFANAHWGTESFRGIRLSPSGEARSGLLIAFNQVTHKPLCLCRRRSRKDAPDIRQVLSLQRLLRHVGLSVLLEMEWASLPGNTGKPRFSSSLETFVDSADKQPDTHAVDGLVSCGGSHANGLLL
jgi:hypothetical protein